MFRKHEPVEPTSKRAAMRQRIVKRAALEFRDGMYGILIQYTTMLFVYRL